MLSYEVKKNGLVVRLTGELDHSAAEELRRELDRLIAETGAKQLLLDLSGLTFMDSSGIGLIIGRYKKMARRGGSVAVIAANRRIDKLFDMAGLYQLVERRA